MESLEQITKTKEFFNLTNFIISKVNSPYEEKSYVIQNNDTMEKILRKFKINNSDIKNVN